MYTLKYANVRKKLFTSYTVSSMFSSYLFIFADIVILKFFTSQGEGEGFFAKKWPKNLRNLRNYEKALRAKSASMRGRER